MNERYLLDLSFREDASSRFGADKRMGATCRSAGLGLESAQCGFSERCSFYQSFKNTWFVRIDR